MQIFCKLSIYGVLSLSLMAIVGCTQPGETTTMGAAAGGAIGAGVGAVIGATSGNAGSGLLAGAALGSASGALVGNSLEAQEQRARLTDDSLNQRESAINARREEIERLRLESSDPQALSNGSKNTISGKTSWSDTFESRARYNVNKTARSEWGVPATDLINPHKSKSAQKTGLQSERLYSLESKSAGVTRAFGVNRAEVKNTNLQAAGTRSFDSGVVKSQKSSSQSPRLDSKTVDPVINVAASKARNSNILESDITAKDNATLEGSVSAISKNSSANIDTTELGFSQAVNSKSETAFNENTSLLQSSQEGCIQAGSEVAKADLVSESSDKLFHLRRALRLCPDNAQYHLRLAEIYLASNRNEDARQEFTEVLRLDPSIESARVQLNRLNNTPDKIASSAVDQVKNDQTY